MVKVTVGSVENVVRAGGIVEQWRQVTRKVAGAVLVQRVLVGDLETLFTSDAIQALVQNPNARHPGSW
jgi:hypothetical protein